MLVILEGLDNTGKTTIAKMLMPYYKIQGKNAILAKELSTPVGEQIKQLSREGKLTPELKSYLFPADRRLLLDGLGEIKKAYKSILDEYSLEQIDGSQSINDIFKHIARRVNNKMKEKEDIER